MSCTNPGWISSALRTAPPGSGCASSTRTRHPASVSRFAATSPFGPAPITTASMSLTDGRYPTPVASPALGKRHDPPVPATAAIELSRVGLVEQGTVVLRAVDWTARRDERWVILGPNGSGKTSMLRLLAFQRAPSTGDVTVLGDRYGTVDVRVARQRVGLASSALLQRLRPSLTAHDVVVMGRDAALEPWWATYSEADHHR